jgi:hypothetical protein
MKVRESHPTPTQLESVKLLTVIFSVVCQAEKQSKQFKLSFHG